jgi:hypothetical protein
MALGWSYRQLLLADGPARVNDETDRDREKRGLRIKVAAREATIRTVPHPERARRSVRRLSNSSSQTLAHCSDNCLVCGKLLRNLLKTVQNILHCLVVRGDRLVIEKSGRSDSF